MKINNIQYISNIHLEIFKDIAPYITAVNKSLDRLNTIISDLKVNDLTISINNLNKSINNFSKQLNSDVKTSDESLKRYHDTIDTLEKTIAGGLLKSIDDFAVSIGFSNGLIIDIIAVTMEFLGALYSIGTFLAVLEALFEGSFSFILKVVGVGFSMVSQGVLAAGRGILLALGPASPAYLGAMALLGLLEHINMILSNISLWDNRIENNTQTISSTQPGQDNLKYVKYSDEVKIVPIEEGVVKFDFETEGAPKFTNQKAVKDDSISFGAIKEKNSFGKMQFSKLSFDYTNAENEIKLLNTRQQILQEIEEIEKRIAIEDLPLQKKEFEKQIETLRFRIRLLSGEFEKLNLEGLEPKKLLEDNSEIKSRSGTTSSKKNKDNKENIFFLKAQLGLIKSFEEAIPNLQRSFQGIFAAFVPPQGAADPFREFMKEVVLTFLKSVETMLYEAGAASFFKAILTGGLSLTKDVGLMAAGMVALEIAKGFVGGFAKGTDYLHKTGYALVGEQGPELVYLNRGAKIYNNNDTTKMLNRARANQPQALNVNNVYIASSLDAISFFRVNYPKYKKFKTLQAV